MFRKRKELSPLDPLEKDIFEQWNHALDRIESNKMKPELTQEELIAPCLLMAQCLTVSVNETTSDKLEPVHVNFFTTYTDEVSQILKNTNPEALNEELNLALMNSIYNLYTKLFLKTNKNPVEKKLQLQLETSLLSLRTFIQHEDLESFSVSLDLKSSSVIDMRSHSLQQPLNAIIDEFFANISPLINIKIIPATRDAVLKRLIANRANIEKETEQLLIDYSNSSTAQLLSKIPALLSDPMSFALANSHLNKIQDKLQDLTPPELAQFYFLLGRIGTMKGLTQSAIYYFHKALNSEGIFIGSCFIITTRLLCAIQQYMMEKSNEQENSQVRESISLLTRGKKGKVTHFLRRDPILSLCDDVGSPMTLFQPKQGLKPSQLSKRRLPQERLEILRPTVSHYVQASIFICHTNISMINLFVDNIMKLSFKENVALPAEQKPSPRPL